MPGAGGKSAKVAGGGGGGGRTPADSDEDSTDSGRRVVVPVHVAIDVMQHSHLQPGIKVLCWQGRELLYATIRDVRPPEADGNGNGWHYLVHFSGYRKSSGALVVPTFALVASTRCAPSGPPPQRPSRARRLCGACHRRSNGQATLATAHAFSPLNRGNADFTSTLLTVSPTRHNPSAHPLSLSSLPSSPTTLRRMGWREPPARAVRAEHPPPARDAGHPGDSPCHL